MSHDAPINMTHWAEITLAYAIYASGVAAAPDELTRAARHEAELLIAPIRGNRLGNIVFGHADATALYDKTMARANELRTCTPAPDKGMQL